MSRKNASGKSRGRERRERQRVERERAVSGRTPSRKLFAVSAVAMTAVIVAITVFYTVSDNPQEGSGSPKPEDTEFSSDEPKAMAEAGASDTYLARPLPADDAKAKALIRSEYYNFDGFTIYPSEKYVDIRELLVPKRDLNREELEIISGALSLIIAIEGEDSPITEIVQDLLSRKEERTLNGFVLFGEKVAIGTSVESLMAFDGGWQSQLGYIYIGEHQLPYLLLLTSTLYQELFHAAQSQVEALTLENNVESELEAHRAQLEFNRRLTEVLDDDTSNGRRFRLELEVISENVRDSIRRYEQGSIDRSGLSIQPE